MLIADDATGWHLNTDLAVVGSSAGALVAAIIAARQGSHVLVHERVKELGGGLTRGPGMIPAAGTRLQRAAGIVDGPEAFANDLLGARAPDDRDPGDPGFTLSACRAVAELVDWLVAENVSRLVFVPSIVAHHQGAPRLHAHERGTGADLSADLVRCASKESRVSLRTTSVVEDLWVDQGGAVVGIAARERRGPINIRAGRVLLASGGFSGNADLVSTHQPDLAEIPFAGIPGALGDGLRWGMACGAATRRLEACWVTPFAVTPGGYPVSESVVRDGGLLVNQQGARFVDETAAALTVARAILTQPGRLAYLLFDERIYRAVRETDPYFARLIVPRAVRRGSNLADLARHFEIDIDNLTGTLDGFHAQTPTGTDPFGRAPITAPLQPPFHAVGASAPRPRTLGGLRVDAEARVLRPDGTPIANLYACGGVAADLCGDGRSPYPVSHDCLTSMALGWLATHRPGADATV